MEIGPWPTRIDRQVLIAAGVDDVEGDCVAYIQHAHDTGSSIVRCARDGLLIPCVELGDRPLRPAERCVVVHSPVIDAYGEQPSCSHGQGVVVQADVRDVLRLCQRHHVGGARGKHGALYHSVDSVWCGGRGF